MQTSLLGGPIYMCSPQTGIVRQAGALSTYNQSFVLCLFFVFITLISLYTLSVHSQSFAHFVIHSQFTLCHSLTVIAHLVIHSQSFAHFVIHSQSLHTLSFTHSHLHTLSFTQSLHTLSFTHSHCTPCHIQSLHILSFTHSHLPTLSFTQSFAHFVIHSQSLHTLSHSLSHCTSCHSSTVTSHFVNSLTVTALFVYSLAVTTYSVYPNHIHPWLSTYTHPFMPSFLALLFFSLSSPSFSPCRLQYN